MKINQIIPFFGFLLVVLLLSSCTGTLLLPKGETLYTGASVKVKAPEKNWKTGKLEAALPKAIVLPRPNRKLLWFRGGVAVYNTFHNPNKEKGIGNWISDKLGKAPVLFTEDIAVTHQKSLTAVAAEFGFFEVNVVTKKGGLGKRTKLKHTVHLLKPAKILGNLEFPSDTGAVEQRLLELKNSTLLKAGLPYNYELLKLERLRLTDSLRNEGWFYLSPDHFVFDADTLQQSGEVLLSLRFKDDVTMVEKRRYRIGEILIFPDYDLKVAGQQGQRMEEVDDCVSIVYTEKSVRNSLILDNIRFRCGEYFSNENYRTSLFRLLNLQFFKFVNIRFERSALSDSLLEVHVLLTPTIPQKAEASLSGVFSPQNYFGTQTGLSLQHRNIFGGAEILRFAWEGALLRLTTDDTKSTLFYSNTKAQLTLPQKIPGLRLRQKNALSATKFSLGHTLYYFREPLVEDEKIGIGFHEVDAEGGFVWKKNRQGTITHELNPLSLKLRFVTMSIAGVKNLLLEEILTATTVAERNDVLFFATLLELRPNYAFVFDDRQGVPRKWSNLFRQKFSFLSSKFLLPDYIDKAANIGYSVNIFTESDFRQYINLSRKAILAWRLSLFAGLPVKEGSVISPTNLYTIGGASSVRAFAPRSIGPGASNPPDIGSSDVVLNILTNHTGNLMLLGNVELRRKLGKSWEVAAFVDAGNVWLSDPNEKLPGGDFSTDRFYKELASGTGAGIRFTLGFFVLRLDVAIPLSKPYNPAGSRLIGQPGFGSYVPRGNLAFGYPF